MPAEQPDHDVPHHDVQQVVQRRQKPPHKEREQYDLHQVGSDGQDEGYRKTRAAATRGALRAPPVELPLRLHE